MSTLINLEGLKDKYIVSLFEDTKEEDIIEIIPRIKGELDEEQKNRLVDYLCKQLGYDIGDFQCTIFNYIDTKDINTEYVSKNIEKINNWIRGGEEPDSNIINFKCIFDFVCKFHPDRDDFLREEGYKIEDIYYRYYTNYVKIYNPHYYDYHNDGFMNFRYTHYIERMVLKLK